MSLVCCVHTGDLVIQVADCRLSCEGRHADGFVKTVFFECADATCLISFVGVANLRGMIINQWLVELADSNRMWELPLEECWKRVSGQAGHDILTASHVDKRLTIVFSGIRNGLRFNCLISNCQDQSSYLPQVTPLFGIYLREFTLTSARPLGVKFLGDTSGLHEDTKSALRALRRSGSFHSDPEQAASKIADLIRRASVSNESQGSVSQCCTSAYLDLKEKRVYTKFHNPQKQAVKVLPDMITPLFIIRGMNTIKNENIIKGNFSFKSHKPGITHDQVIKMMMRWMKLDIPEHLVDVPNLDELQ